jgi:hypothetical protein
VHTLVSTASITKTVEELLGLAPASMGDQLATDMRDWFTTEPDYAPYDALPFVAPKTTPAGLRIGELSSRLDTSGPDTDSFRQAQLSHLAAQADRLSSQAGAMSDEAYREAQDDPYERARKIVGEDHLADADG